jgi:predicted transcriptional regulator
MDWNKYGYIFASDYRKKVVSSLLKGPKTPKQIALEINLYLSHVSKTLNELQERGVAECLTPTLKRGRIYNLTEEGREIANYIKENSK